MPGRGSILSHLNWKVAIEAIGFIAIVASLILVAFKLRQNTIAVKTTAAQEAVNVGREQVLMLARDPELARIASTPYPELDALDQQRAFWIGRSFLIGM